MNKCATLLYVCFWTWAEKTSPGLSAWVPSTMIFSRTLLPFLQPFPGKWLAEVPRHTCWARCTLRIGVRSSTDPPPPCCFTKTCACPNVSHLCLQSSVLMHNYRSCTHHRNHLAEANMLLSSPGLFLYRTVDHTWQHLSDVTLHQFKMAFSSSCSHQSFLYAMMNWDRSES